MDELENRIHAVLGDPAQMEKLSKIASAIMGGGGDSAEAAPPQEEAPPDDGMLQGILRGLKSGGGRHSESRSLLEAMKPFLAEKRRTKIDKAMKLARLASIAELAVGGLGGEEHV